MPRRPENDMTVAVLLASADAPRNPTSSSQLAYETFWDTMLSLSKVFTRARYLFEELKTEDWVFIELSRMGIYRAITALDATYEFHIADNFPGLPRGPLVII